MNTERIFNLFIYFNDGTATKAGVRFHKVWGTDEEKMLFLQTHVPVDHPKAKLFELSRSFTPEQWQSQLRLGGALGHFEAVLKEMRAPLKPIFGLTAIVNGVPEIDQVIGPGPFRGEDVTDFKREGSMVDYLVDYTDGRDFHLSKLINDDYFEAIKVLFNAGHHVSAAKLLMSCIDTLAFVEFGDIQGNFTKWLEEYCRLEPLGITSDELWEFRNSVLHMTNLSSRAVLRGRRARITPFVASLDCVIPVNTGDDRPFNLFGLYHVVAEGISRWGETYNGDHAKFLEFIERYDTTISDARLASIQYSKRVED